MPLLSRSTANISKAIPDFQSAKNWSSSTLNSSAATKSIPKRLAPASVAIRTCHIYLHRSKSCPFRNSMEAPPVGCSQCVVSSLLRHKASK